MSNYKKLRFIIHHTFDSRARRKLPELEEAKRVALDEFDTIDLSGFSETSFTKKVMRFQDFCVYSEYPMYKL